MKRKDYPRCVRIRKKNFHVTMAPPDPRRTPNSIVLAKAMHVTSLAECSRRYGSNAKTKRLFGKVVEASIQRGPNGRSTTMVTVNFYMGSLEVIKQKCYNSLGIAVALMLGRADNQVVTNRYKPLHG